MTGAPQILAGSPRIAYERGGSGGALVFLHGIGGNRTNWRPQMDALAAQYRVLAPDMRGYGDSDGYDGPCRIEDMADDVARLLDAEGVQRAHLCGLSMGGFVAQVFWQRHRARVGAMVLADTAIGPAAALTEQEVRDFVAARKAPLLAGQTPADLAPRNAPMLAMPDAPAALIKQYVDSLASVPKETVLKTLDTVSAFRGIPEIGAIAAPVLVLVGSGDRLFPEPAARALASAIPNAAFGIIPNAGHIANMEQPEAFNQAITDFLSRHPV